jgi:hypothetical protein
MEGQYGDARAESNRAGNRGQVGQSHPRLDETGIRAEVGGVAIGDPAEGNENMLTDPKRLESRVLGHPSERPQLPRIDGREVQAKLHQRSSPELRSSPRNWRWRAPQQNDVF